MKKIFISALIIISIITLVGCSNKKEELKVYKQREKAIVKNKNGTDMYSLTINSVKKVNDFKYKEDFNNPQEIIEVTYTYDNLNKKDKNLYIHSQDLTVLDSKNSVADASSMFSKGKPKDLTKGANCTVNAYYGLKNKSDEVKILFESDQYGQKVEFEIPIKEDSISQDELNKKIAKEAVKADFIKINDNQMYGKSVFATGEVSNIIPDAVFPTFNLKVPEDDGYEVYEISLVDKGMLKDIEEGKTITVYGKVMDRNDSGMPRISGNLIK